MKHYYGVSRGETGDYGIGDVVQGTQWTQEIDGTILIDNEPVYNLWYIENNKIVDVEL